MSSIVECAKDRGPGSIFFTWKYGHWSLIIDQSLLQELRVGCSVSSKKSPNIDKANLFLSSERSSLHYVEVKRVRRQTQHPCLCHLLVVQLYSFQQYPCNSTRTSRDQGLMRFPFGGDILILIINNQGKVCNISNIWKYKNAPNYICCQITQPY